MYVYVCVCVCECICSQQEVTFLLLKAKKGARAARAGGVDIWPRNQTRPIWMECIALLIHLNGRTRL